MLVSCKLRSVICIFKSFSNSLVIILAGLPSARLCTTSSCNFGSSAATYFSCSSNLLRKLLLSQQGKDFSKSGTRSFLFDVTKIQLYHFFSFCLVFFLFLVGRGVVGVAKLTLLRQEEISVVVVICSNYPFVILAILVHITANLCALNHFLDCNSTFLSGIISLCLSCNSCTRLQNV